jgi:hypothetical protein
MLYDFNEIKEGQFIRVINTGENEGKTEVDLEVKKVTNASIFSEEFFALGIRGYSSNEVKNKIVKWSKSARRLNEDYNSYKIIGYYNKED